MNAAQTQAAQELAMWIAALAVALAAPAATHAEDTAVEPSCPSPTLLGSIPADGAVEVAPDAPITVAIDGGVCGERITFLLEDDVGMVADGEFDDEIWVGTGRQLRLDLPLEEATPYTLTVLSDFNGEPLELNFRTGSTGFVPPELDDMTVDLNVIDVLDVGGGRLDVLVAVDITAPPELLVHLSDNGQFTRLLRVSDGTTFTETLSIFTEGDEVCMHARLEDTEGTQGEWFAACQAVEAPAQSDDDEDGEDDEPYKPSRCQAAPAPLSGALALVALVALGRRRRER